MNVEIGTEAAQLPEKEYINGIFLAVHDHLTPHQHVGLVKRYSVALIQIFLLTFCKTKFTLASFLFYSPSHI
jgi:hypothetical protein